MKVYIAGPDVFYKNAAELAELARTECRIRGMEALCPVDNSIADGPPAQMAKEIYDKNCAMIQRADAICANIEPFRGPSADAGTVWEIGYGYGLGKPVVGFTSVMLEYKDKVDGNDQHLVEDFGGIDNLMITHALESVHSTIQEALDALRPAQDN